MTAGRNKTPARVQVFFFEKPKPAPTRTIEEMLTAPGVPPEMERRPGPPPPGPDEQDEPTVATDPSPETQRQARAARPTPPSRPAARTRRPQAAPRPSPQPGAATPSRRGRAEAGDRNATPRDRPAAGAIRRRPPNARGAPTPPDRLSNRAEALEHHRRKLQALAARSGDQEARFAEAALFGHELFASGRVREAQVVFEGIVASEPDEALAYTMLGSIYLAQQDEPRALALFEAALAIDPEDSAALVARAEIRLGRGQPNFAIGDLERASALCSGRDPFGERARALLVLARTLSRTQR